MEEAFLPEEIIVLILTFLPVKSLIRFTCVSKRFRFVILFDPKFAKSQLKAAAASKTHRLLFCTMNHDKDKLCRLESLDLDTPFGDESSVRKLTLPFELPAAVNKSRDVSTLLLLGTCNGIVFLAFHSKIFYMWNPSIGLYKRLPDLVFPPHYYAVGYLPATDDYRVFIYSMEDTVFVFSTRVNAWKKHHQVKMRTTSYFMNSMGTSLNEALHWVDQHRRIAAFDLDDEEGKFREMSTPNFDNEDGGLSYALIGVSAQGCLSLVRYPTNFTLDCMDVWVMNEYNVRGSWTKLFNLKFLDDHPNGWLVSALLIGTSMVEHLGTEEEKEWLIRTDHEDEGKHGKYMIEGIDLKMIQIQETLIWIDD